MYTLLASDVFDQVVGNPGTSVQPSCLAEDVKSSSLQHTLRQRLCIRKVLYLALLQAGAVHVDGWEQVLEQGGCQLQMLFPTKVVHHYQGGVLYIEAGYLMPLLFLEFVFAVFLVLLFPKVVHHHQGSVLHIKASYLASPLS